MPEKKKKFQAAKPTVEEVEITDAQTEGANPPEEVVEAEAPEKTEADLLKEQLSALDDKLLRVLAEYDNFRKRTAKEKDTIYPQAKADTVEKFLPIIDNFERAMQFDCSDTEFKTGIDMIFKSFMAVMHDFSVSEIGEEGETFNPDIHNAVMHVEDEAYGENVIAQVMQKGYKIGERVVRYAMVKVAN